MTERTFRWLPVIISVVVVIVTVAAAWGSLGTRTARNESEIDDNCERIMEMEQAIPEIQTDIEWIRLALERMEKE